MRWWGQLKAAWDLAGELVELREQILGRDAALDDVVQRLNTIDERTRKQDYRARKAEEHAFFAPPLDTAAPQGKAAVRARAKQLGFIT